MKTDRIYLRITEEEKKKISEAAKSKGLSLSSYCIMKALEECSSNDDNYIYKESVDIHIKLDREILKKIDTNARKSLMSRSAYIAKAVISNTIIIDGLKDFTKEIALATIPTLYRNLPRVPEKELGFFDFGADMIWRNLVYRLLINIPDGDKIETITQLFDSCDLYGKFDIIKIVGHSHNLASKTEEEKLEEIFLSDISVATIKELSESYNLSRILYFSFLKGKRISNDRLSSHEVLLSLLKSSISEVKSQRGSDPTIYREKTLHWDNLVKIYGDETKLVKLIEEIANNQEIIEKDYVKLAIKYKDGYRNKESIDNDDELD